MKTVSMSGSLRENVGKKDAKRHRKEGRVPCVLYGGEKQFHFVVEERSFQKVLFSPESHYIKLDLGGNSYNCILKEVQYHPVSDRVLHADFLEFFPDKPITTSIPLRLTGTAPGIIKGGQLIKKFRHLMVRGLPGEIPEFIEVDISMLEINDSVHVKDIVTEKFEIVEQAERYVVGVKTTRLAAPEEVAPGAEEVPKEGAAPAETLEKLEKEKEEKEKEKKKYAS
jgi:large subunit ribosomal protein L25